MRILAVVVLLAIFAVPLSASAEVMTSDPNVPGAQLATENTPDNSSDPRLTKKITFEATDQPLAAVLQSLSRASGISLLPSSAPDNWQVRERTTIVFMSDAPVSEFKDGIAELFDYRWTRTSLEQPWTYLLRETDKAKMIRQGLIDQKQQEEIEQRRQGIQDALVEADKSTKMTPQEVREAKLHNPWLYYLATSPSGKLWAEFIRSVPAEWWDDVALGKNKDVHMDPNGGEFMDIATRIVALPISAVSQPKERHLPAESMNVRIYPGTPESGVFANIEINSMNNGIMEYFPIGDSTSNTLLQTGAANQLMEEGKDWRAATDESWAYGNKLVSEYHKSGNKPTPQDEELLREIEHNPIADKSIKDEDSAMQHLRGLSKETGYTIIWETFDRTRHGIYVPKKCTVQQALSVLAEPDYTFERQGNVIYIRHKEWAKQRALQVSQDLIKKWETSARAHDGLNFEDLYDVAKHTTREQVEYTLRKNRLLKVAGLDYLLVIYDALREASMLPEEQSKLYRSETGVSVRAIRDSLLNSTTPGDRESLAEYQKLVDKDPGAVTGMSCAESSDSNSSYRYRITFFTKHSDGKVTSFTHKYRSKDEINAFRAIVKQIDEEAKQRQSKEPTLSPVP